MESHNSTTMIMSYTEDVTSHPKFGGLKLYTTKKSYVDQWLGVFITLTIL